MWSWADQCPPLSLANKQIVDIVTARGGGAVEQDEERDFGQAVVASEVFDVAIRGAQGRSNPPAPPQEALDLRFITAPAMSLNPANVQYHHHTLIHFLLLT
jgi:hypothetical protein